MSSITLYDTTLRDGAQREGISFSVVDKINIVRKLDELGIRFIEGGWPGSNPKDTDFFRRTSKLSLSNSRLVAFGSTRRPKVKAEKDSGLYTLLQAGTQNVTIVGKSSEKQIKKGASNRITRSGHQHPFHHHTLIRYATLRS